LANARGRGTPQVPHLAVPILLIWLSEGILIAFSSIAVGATSHVARERDA
jgi:hypothetical protein